MQDDKSRRSNRVHSRPAENGGCAESDAYALRMRENGSFWLRNINHLQVLEQARRLYRKQVACVHPDKPGGSLEQTILLNNTWNKIQRRFKQHGHELW